VIHTWNGVEYEFFGLGDWDGGTGKTGFRNLWFGFVKFVEWSTRFYKSSVKFVKDFLSST